MMRRGASDMIMNHFVMQWRRRLPVFFFALLHSAARLTAQDSFTSCGVLDQSVSFAPLGDADVKDAAADDQVQT